MVGLRLRSKGGGGERKVRLRVCGKVKDMEDMQQDEDSEYFKK